MELNPNHPTTQRAREQWHKIAALIMVKVGKTEIEITMHDIQELMTQSKSIVVEERADCMRVRLVDEKVAEELARRHGGRTIDS